MEVVGIRRFAERLQPAESRRGQLQLRLLAYAAAGGPALPARRRHTRRIVMRRSLIGLAALVACENSFEPASYVQGVRVLAVKAEPAEVAPGATTTLTALAVDPGRGTLMASWDACTEPPLAGYGAINSVCLQKDAAPYLVPLGTGLSLAATLPLVAPTDFAPPDASGGLYLPIRVRVESAHQRVDATYHMR